VEFRILGPLEVADETGLIDIPAPMQRALLACLVIHANQVVSVDRLLEHIWGEEQPETGLKTLRYHISKLRHTLQPDLRSGQESVIVTRSPGYSLRVDRDLIDADRFQRHLDRARSAAESDPASAIVELDAALQLWRGPALSGFQDEPWATLEAGRLEELRLVAVEDRFAAGLALGRHPTLIADLEKFCHEHPFRERPWGQWMLALYRSDRQADALRAYRSLRRNLGDELGIEPSPELQHLEDRILAQDRDLLEQLPHNFRGYKLLGRLGQGASGVVWRARQPSVGREVAVKAIQPEYANRPEFVRRFEAEAQLVASLEHPHIVPLYDFWRDPGGAYLAMPLMRGGSLNRSAPEAWPIERIHRLIGQIGRALAYAHRRGVVHGDLHPGNVLLDEEGNAFLADFGMAARLGNSLSSAPLAYTSPERRTGEAPSPGGDIYSLGAIAYRLATGTPPPHDIPSARSLRADLPDALHSVIARATHPDPQERFPDTAALLTDLDYALTPTTESRPAVETRNPYKGLRPFSEADAPDFSGRDALIEEMLTMVSLRRLVAVVGPSGSGKSSAVRAGLIPALRAGRTAGSQDWLITDLYPGVDPFAELEVALLAVAVEQPDDLVNLLRNPKEAATAIARVAPPNAEVLIVIDQFEELFTATLNEDLRRRFLETLDRLATSPSGRVRILITMRADYLGRPLQYPSFGRLVRQGLISVTSPDEVELARAISLPAGRVGLELEEGLEPRIINDVLDQPGGLPLMEYALTELFHRRVENRLTIEAYEQSGGVLGSLGRRPEQLYLELDSAEQAAAQQVLLRLVGVDETTEATRRRVQILELRELDLERSALDRVLDTFGSARLLTFDRDPDTRAPMVELAHESLISRWERLRLWIEKHREALLLRRRFAASLKEWIDSQEDPGYLLSGGRLQQFESWAETADLTLTAAERRFLTESRRREDQTATRRRRRRFGVAAALTALALAASAFGVTARIQADRALREAQENRARELAAASLAAIETDPELGLLLALEAASITRYDDETNRQGAGTLPRETEEALHEAVVASRLEAILSESYDGFIAAGPDGTFYVGSELLDHVAQAQIVDRELLTTPLPLPGGRPEVSPDGSLLAVAHSDGSISMWNLATNGQIARVEEAHSMQAFPPVFSPDASTLATISIDGTIGVWDAATLSRLFMLDHGYTSWNIEDLAFSPDGSRLVAAVPGAEPMAWDLTTGAQLEAPFAGHLCPGITQVEFTPDESQLLSTGRCDWQIRTWDAETGELLSGFLAHDAGIQSLAVSPDGRWFATGDSQGLIKIWENAYPFATAPILARTLAGHDGLVIDLEFTADGRYLVSGGQHGAPRVWDISPEGSREWLTLASPAELMAVAVSPDGSKIATSGLRFVSVRHASTGEKLFDLEAPLPSASPDSRVWMFGVAFSPDGTTLGTAGLAEDDGSGAAILWNAATGEPIRTLVEGDMGPTTIAFSGDGSHVAVNTMEGAFVWDARTFAAVLTADPPDVSPNQRHAGGVALNSDGSRLAVMQITNDDEVPDVEVWDVRTGELLQAIHHFHSHPGEGTVEFSPDGKRLLTTGAGGTKIWDAETWVEVATLDVDGAASASGAYSGDGTLIGTVDGGGAVRIWETTDYAEVLTLPGHDSGGGPVAFSPDGARLYSGSVMGGELRVWALDANDLIEIARSRITRDFTAAECVAYRIERCVGE
jgi:WD40 repeat protein/serine/threonine protein kinase/DNA-binding winged helix-turn-helix (wHTH) protein